MTVVAGSIGRGKKQVRLRGATGWITADGRYLLLHVWQATWGACWDPTVPGRWIAYEQQVPWDVAPDAVTVEGERWGRLPGDWRTLGDVTAAIASGPSVSAVGPLPRARAEAERTSPRPDSLRRAEEAITRALVGADFGTQWLTPRADGFEITVDDLRVRVEVTDAG